MRFVNAIVGAVLVLSLMAGCAKNDPTGPRAVNPNDANRMNAERSTFDSTKEPSINATTYYASGQLAESQGARYAAIEQYRKALNVDPRHQPSLYRMAIVQAELRLFADAIETWKRYIEATDDSAVGYSNLGFCYELAGRPVEAEAAYKKGIEKEPRSVPCRTNYGLMLARHDRIDEAMVQLQAVLSPAEVHYNLASVYEHRGQPEKAKIHYRKALEADPHFAHAQSRLAALE